MKYVNLILMQIRLL